LLASQKAQTKVLELKPDFFDEFLVQINLTPDQREKKKSFWDKTTTTKIDEKKHLFNLTPTMSTR
jgi:hypothetical protein